MRPETTLLSQIQNFGSEMSIEAIAIRHVSESPSLKGLRNPRLTERDMSLTTTLHIGAGVVALIAATPLVLPRNVHVTRSAVIDAAPADILALAASNTGYQAFNPYAEADPNLSITHFGPNTGVGSGFRFEGKDGKGTQTVTATTDTSVTYHIDLGALGQPTQRIEAVAVTGGSEVTWHLDSDLGFNPMFRVFGLFMDSMIGKTFDTGLARLAQAVA